MNGTVREVTPDVDAGTLLAGAQFIDAFRVEIGAATVNAREACTRMVLHGPRWIDALLRLRNILLTPFGLKTGSTSPMRICTMPPRFNCVRVPSVLPTMDSLSASAQIFFSRSAFCAA